MRHLYAYYLCLLLLLGSFHAQAQSHRLQPAAYALGTKQEFLASLHSQTVSARISVPTVHLAVSATQAFTGVITHQQARGAEQVVVGTLSNMPGSSFYLEVGNNTVTGHLVLGKQRKAYRYVTDSQARVTVVAVKEEDIFCTGYPVEDVARMALTPARKRSTSSDQQRVTGTLQSNPGAPVVIFLDFDGAYVPGGTPWNNGNPINAAPSTLSESAIRDAWEITSNDYIHYNVNVTTDENVYNAKLRGRRIRCIITPTNYFYTGVGGVAIVGTFQRNNLSGLFWRPEVPCFVFNSTARGCGEAASHEVGHTFTLKHDGLTTPTPNNPDPGYYLGHGNWAPIMGVGYYRPVVQWSRGEYDGANNTEDDEAIIASQLSTIASPYVADTHGDDASSATPLTRSPFFGPDYASAYSMINSRTDKDYFSFTTNNGPVQFTIRPMVGVAVAGNLDILVRLYDANRIEIGQYTSVPGLPAFINTTLAAGTYYLSVDGTGELSPANTGYSDYGSIGNFEIVGTTSGQSAFTLPVPYGQVIWLKGSNQRYVTSNVSAGMDVWSDRASVQNWEQFTVVNVGNGQVALYNEGYYVSGESSYNRVVCNRTAIGPWEKFNWISNADGTISLQASNSLYVSSENGQSRMTCNRSSIGPWEKFAWGTGFGSKTAAVGSASTAASSSLFYPNPITDDLVSYTLPEGVTQYTVRVRDLYGNTVQEASFKAPSSRNTLNTATWQPGLYTINITSPTFRTTVKVEKR